MGEVTKAQMMFIVDRRERGPDSSVGGSYVSPFRWLEEFAIPAPEFFRSLLEGYALPLVVYDAQR